MTHGNVDETCVIRKTGMWCRARAPVPPVYAAAATLRTFLRAMVAGHDSCYLLMRMITMFHCFHEMRSVSVKTEG
jgi:hypothetical protein